MNKSWIRRGVVALCALGAVAAFAAPSMGGTTTVKAAGSNGAWIWSKTSVDVTKGGKVAWKNPTFVPHTVTFYKGGITSSVRIDPGESTSKAFNKAGSFYYRCKMHSSITDGACAGMCARVKVTNG